MLFRKAAVIGTGLIGGSLALALKKGGLAREVVGVSRHQGSLNSALRMKAIDRGSRSLDIIKGADLVVLATPVNIIIESRERLLKIAGKDCLVTDVGSTKEKITALLERSFPNFVGAHPLAGSEKRGMANARQDIFKDSLCILTPTASTNAAALAKIRSLWTRMGAKVILLSPTQHDRALSFTSHLSHVIAFALMKSIPAGLLKFASGGLKDTTRIAASDPGLWQSIFLTNRTGILKALDLFEKNLREAKSAIRRGDARSLRRILKQAQKKRKSIE
ncbi:MAG: prephenate dehydrogenase/arogenate dehydrogenase family protein [Candidatus Omnitrophota bacterium]